MKQEIERKWRLASTPSLVGFKSYSIKQGYVFVGQKEFRLRQKGQKYYFTFKGPGGVVRKEWERKIPALLFYLFWPLTWGSRLYKERYYYPYNYKTIEIDIFKRRLEGLLIMEVEFESEEEARSFEVPKDLNISEDVSSNPKYRAISLIRQGIPVHIDKKV